MALTLITEGATSAANDLNQIVNLLNGTDTATQMTVNGPIAAQMPGMAAPLRYVGGVQARPPAPFSIAYLQTDPPQLTPFDADTTGSTYYQNGDLSWASAGGPLTIYAGNGFTSLANPIGVGGYACRVHQAGAQSITTSGNNWVTGDTVDFDPRGMFQPSFLTGSAITIPFNGVWAVAGAIHSSGVNAMNVSWQLSGYQDQLDAFNPIYGVQVSTTSDNTHKYTGTCFFGINSYGPGMQLAFRPPSPPAANFNLDVSGADRTYLAVWLVA